MANEDYCLLKDFKLGIKTEDGVNFKFCFWVYLIKPASLPCNLVRQVHADSSDDLPFILLNEHNQLMLYALLQSASQEEAIEQGNLCSEFPHASMTADFPSEKWVHVGCEVSTDLLRLHIDGKIVGEKPLTPLLNNELGFTLKKTASVNIEGETGVQGYIHNAEALPSAYSIKDQYSKDQPFKLTIDDSSASEIEEDNDGVWSVVGGKASFCKNFSLDVVLLDAFGQPVRKEFEIIASLLYADTRAPVERTSDDEAPLLTSHGGIEYASYDMPSKLVQGRATFKLKISQLSSKCDNRLFCIKFDVPKVGRYPFLEALSRPILCISQNSDTQTTPTLIWKRPISAIHTLNGCQYPAPVDGCLELHHNTVCEAKPSPSSKRVRLGQENISTRFMSDNPMRQHDEECNSHMWKSSQVTSGVRTSLEGRTENNETDKSGSESGSTEVESMGSKTMPNSVSLVSDSAIFRYCLGSLTERPLMLREISGSASYEELTAFADQVSLFSGCSHHRNQITNAKRLIEEGTRVWNLISPKNQPVLWDSAVNEIGQQFMNIACCNIRYLMPQDFRVLRRIAGCQEHIGQENFEKLWCWLFPVALTISRNFVNALWRSASPKWIEGFITKEEAESSLQGPRGSQELGTFILRFPTSRSWPHPDAGCLVVTYVGSGYTIRHRLLSFDYIYGIYEKEMNVKPLQDMLLNEPELSRPGRVVRGH